MTDTGAGMGILRERIPRRALLRGLGIAVVGSGLAPLGLRMAPSPTSRRVAPLSQAAFAAHHGEVFHVHVGASRWVAVALVDVVDRSRDAAGAAGSRRVGRSAGECFTVVFRGPRDQALPQETYTFTHDHMGAFALFIVPGASGPHDIHYEALFNRLPA